MTVGKNSLKKSERGQALILIVFAIIGLIGVIALAVDGGNAYAAKRNIQSSADAASLGGALARIRRGSNWVPAVYDIAAQNGYDNDGVTNTVKVYSPPASGAYAGNIEYIQVIITAQVPTYFAGVIGIPYTTVSGESVSRTKTPEFGNILEGNAVITLGPTSDCNNNPGLRIYGEATLDISGGGVFVNSNDPGCALKQYGSGSIRLNGTSVISVVGGANIQKPKLLTPYPPTTNVSSIPYPPPFMMPNVNCAQDAKILEDGVTLSAGDWSDGDFPPEGVKFLEKGNYCIHTDFVLNGNMHLEGKNVTFFMPDGAIHWSRTATINLQAPTSGDNAGLLLYVPIQNKKNITISGNLDSALTGTILAPGAEIRLSGLESNHGLHGQIIAYAIQAYSQSNTVIIYDDDDNWNTYTMPEIQLSE